MPYISTSNSSSRAGYIADENGEPILPPGMKKHLQDDMNRTIDDF
jgi:hypothetical protein